MGNYSHASIYTWMNDYFQRIGVARSYSELMLLSLLVFDATLLKTTASIHHRGIFKSKVRSRTKRANKLRKRGPFSSLPISRHT